jgi:lipid-A-disaccharide synthase
LRKLDNEKAIALYPSESIKNILEKSLAKFPDVADRVKIVDKSALPLKAKAVMMSSGTMSLCCSLAGIPGAIVYKANPITYVLGRMLVKIQYLSIANILLDKPAWREFIQFDATDENIASYMRECLKPEVRTEFLEYANALKKLLHAETKKSASDWLLSEFVK